MARLLGVEIPDGKKVEISLRYIYGIGPKMSVDILKKSNVPLGTVVKKLTTDQINSISNVIRSEYIVEGDLKSLIAQNVKRLIAINSYRGIRHKRKLPARGQRTKTNARTCKGRRVTVGAIRDKTQRKLAKN